MDIFFALLFIILNILDVTTTRKILALGGYEANPIVRFLMKINLFMPIKIAVTLLLAAIIIISPNNINGVLLCGMTLAIVINNYYQLYKISPP